MNQLNERWPEGEQIAKQMLNLYVKKEKEKWNFMGRDRSRGSLRYLGGDNPPIRILIYALKHLSHQYVLLHSQELFQYCFLQYMPLH